MSAKRHAASLLLGVILAACAGTPANPTPLGSSPPAPSPSAEATSGPKPAPATHAAKPSPPLTKATAAPTPAPSVAARVRVGIVWAAPAGTVEFAGPAAVSRGFATGPSLFAYSEEPGSELVDRSTAGLIDLCERSDLSATVELPIGPYTVTASADGLDFEFRLALTSSSTEYRVCRFTVEDAFTSASVVVYGPSGALAVHEWMWPGCFDVCPGNVLFFSRDGDVYSIDPDMDDPDQYDPRETRLTDDPSVDRAPVPIHGAKSDGAPLVAFISERDGQPEIYVMNRDGSDERRLTRDSGVAGCVVPSPEGSQIAFVSVGNGRREIHLVDADGSKQRRLSEIEVVAIGCPAWSPWSPWSPDGRQLAFVARADAGLFVIDADGSNLRRLTAAGEHVLDPGQPTWTWSSTSSGSRIAFGSATATGTQLVVVDADGSNRASLGDTPPWVCPAANGPVIAVVVPGRVDQPADPAATATSFDLAFDGEGLARRLIAQNAAAGACPAWSVDGYSIAYEGAEGIYVIGTDGGSSRLVAPRGRDPKWSSDW